MCEIKLYNKMHCKLKFSGISNQKNIRNSFILLSMSYGRVSSFELESAKKVLKKLIKKQGIITNKIYNNFIITKKPLQSRMGKGKGKYYDMISFVVPGSLIFEVKMKSDIFAKRALIAASKKLSIKSKVFSFLEVYG